MFRDQNQRIECCRIVAKWLKNTSIYFDILDYKGQPTDKALEARDQPSMASHSQIILLKLLFDIYNGSGHFEVAEMWSRMEKRPQEKICMLLTAITDGHTSIDYFVMDEKLIGD